MYSRYIAANSRPAGTNAGPRRGDTHTIGVMRSYVPIKNDMSDLAARVQYVLDPKNDRALQQIAAASTVVARRLDLAYAARKLKAELEEVFNA